MIQGECPSWATEPCIMGIDEAGRGPVIGPMVYGVAFCPLSSKDAMKDRSFADSKTLTEEKREVLYEEVLADQGIGFAIDSISAADISSQMLRSEKVSLNAIAMASTMKLIEEVLALGVNLKEVYCDTVGDATRWRERLEQKFDTISFTVCPKADALYPIVSAASIMAKVSRDREVRGFVGDAVPHGGQPQLPIGSGYPGDPVTVAWLKGNIDKVFGFPAIVRFSWQTTTKLLEDNAIPMKWECEDESDAGQKTLSFGGQASNAVASSGRGRHSYFQSRKLQRIAAF